MDNKFIIIGATLLILWLGRKKRLFQNANVVLKNINVGGTLLQPKVFVTFGFINNTRETGKINRVFGTIYLNERTKIGDIDFAQTTIIQPQQVTDIQIPVDISFAGIAQTIQNLIKQKEGTYSFDGWVTVDGVSVPIDKRISF